MTNATKVASIYARFSGNPTPTVDDIYPYLQLAEQFGSAAATASIINNGPLGNSLFSDSLSLADKVTTVFNGLFGREPLQGGLDYWVDQLENNSAYVNETSMAEAILRGAEANEDLTDWTFVQSYSSTFVEALGEFGDNLEDNLPLTIEELNTLIKNYIENPTEENADLIVKAAEEFGEKIEDTLPLTIEEYYTLIENYIEDPSEENLYLFMNANTSEITDISDLLFYTFNLDISSWDTSTLTYVELLEGDSGTKELSSNPVDETPYGVSDEFNELGSVIDEPNDEILTYFVEIA